MSGTVVSLDAHRQARGGDDACFISCPCGGGEFAVVVRGQPDALFIAGLVCVACPDERGTLVVGGYIQGPSA